MRTFVSHDVFVRFRRGGGRDEIHLVFTGLGEQNRLGKVDFKEVSFKGVLTGASSATIAKLSGF